MAAVLDPDRLLSNCCCSSLGFASAPSRVSDVHQSKYPEAILEVTKMTATRWTVRGISIETADAVRNVAWETGGSLGEIVTLCIKFGLPEARRHLEEMMAGESDLDDVLQRLTQIANQFGAVHPPVIEHNGSPSKHR